MIKKIYSFIAVVSSLMLASCANIYEAGTLTTFNISSIAPKIAQDNVNFLASHYAPATTRFEFQQNTTEDLFGITLVNALRQRGYEVYQNEPKQKSNQSKSQDIESVINNQNSRKIKYLIDNDPNNNIRFQMVIDQKLYSRTYDLEATPLTNWTVKN